MAAAAACLARGIDPDAVREGLRTFPGVAHRLEEVARASTACSTSTTPRRRTSTATLVALEAFDGAGPPDPRRPHARGRTSRRCGPPRRRCAAVYLIGEERPRSRAALAAPACRCTRPATWSARWPPPAPPRGRATSCCCRRPARASTSSPTSRRAASASAQLVEALCETARPMSLPRAATGRRAAARAPHPADGDALPARRRRGDGLQRVLGPDLLGGTATAPRTWCAMSCTARSASWACTCSRGTAHARPGGSRRCCWRLVRAAPARAIPGVGRRGQRRAPLAGRRAAAVPALGAHEARARPLLRRSCWPRRPTRPDARRLLSPLLRSPAPPACSDRLAAGPRDGAGDRLTMCALLIAAGDAAAPCSRSAPGSGSLLVVRLRAGRALPRARLTRSSTRGRTPAAAASSPCRAQIALGSGGLFGLGLGESVQKIFYLPEAHTDFILAVIGEELGVLGVAGRAARFTG